MRGSTERFPRPPDSQTREVGREALGRQADTLEAGRLARHMLVGEAAQLVRERLALVGRKGKRQRQQLVHQHVHERHGAPAVRARHDRNPAEEQVRVDRTLGEAACRQRRAQRRHRRALPVAPLPGLHARERGEAVARVRQQQHIATSQGYAVRLPAEQQVVHLAVRRARQAHMALHGYGDAEFHALPRILREPSVRAQCVLSEADAQAASLVERGIEAVGG